MFKINLPEKLTNTTLWIAYSGGIDSTVLLHMAAEWQKIHPNLILKAIHINHHISPNANVWAAHCQSICETLHIPLTIVDVQLTQRKELGLEAAARAQRYRVFAELLQENQVLLTAHNANDQAETLLLQLLRGAGPKGLAAMPEYKVLGLGKLWRPLLKLARIDIEAYVQQHDLKWIEDESNFSEDYVRNFLRMQIMPKLQTQWPACLSTMARSADHCAQASELLAELAQEDLLKVQGEQAHQLKIDQLRKLSESRQANVLRHWFKQLGFAIPEAKQLTELRLQLLAAKHDAIPLVKWSGVECRRFNDILYVMTPLKPLNKKKYAWPEEREQLQNELGTEQVQQLERLIEQLKAKNSAAGSWNIRFRQGGEVLKIPGRAGTHALKKLLQEAKIPPWVRVRIPLIYIDELLVGLDCSWGVPSLGLGLSSDSPLN